VHDESSFARSSSTYVAAMQDAGSNANVRLSGLRPCNEERPTVVTDVTACLSHSYQVDGIVVRVGLHFLYLNQVKLVFFLHSIISTSDSYQSY
jgi:hypothetical protein